MSRVKHVFITKYDYASIKSYFVMNRYMTSSRVNKIRSILFLDSGKSQACRNKRVRRVRKAKGGKHEWEDFRNDTIISV